MSYNNNFSYYNAPTSSNDWWGSKDTKKSSTFDDNRVVKIDYSNQPYAQNYMQNYAQSMILPSENRAPPPPPEQIHPRHEVLQGTVTQLFGSFGYINDNIIFSKSDVSGQMVKVGDRVAVDATYQPNNPTKYKGERVCKIDDTRFSSTNNNNLSKMKPLSRDLAARIDIPLTPYRQDNSKFDGRSDKKSDLKPEKKYEKKMDSPKRSSPIKEIKKPGTKKPSKFSARLISPIDLTKNESASKSLYKESPKVSLKRKTRSTSRNQKPINKQASADKSSSKVDKVTVMKPIENFALRELDCAALKFRCKNLQPPNQFFHVSLKYQQSFPLNHPMKLGNSCHFKVMDKKVKSIDNYIQNQLNRDIDPEDADTTFSAKVMLLSTDDLAEFYKQTLALAEEFDSTNKIPITKAIKFLVGSIGPNKEFAFGGAWSPSLDGPDPDNNPRVLINTAIRTCKNLTGIDLSGCSSWPKFLELHYYRPLQKVLKKVVNHEINAKSSDNGSINNKSETVNSSDSIEERFDYIEPRMETVVYYIPDIWNCVPSQESWNEIKRMYQEQLTSLMCPPPMVPLSNKLSNSSSTATAATTANTVTNNSHGINSNTTIVNNINGSSVNNDDSSSQDGSQTSKKSSVGDSQDVEEDYNFNENEEVDEKPKDSDAQSVVGEQPTHFSNLNVDGMKIVEIKKELELRKLSIKGVMDQLKARLKTALEKEELEEKLKTDPPGVIKMSSEVKHQSETVLSESDKNELKLLYALPDVPHIIVHHNLKYQDNKMKIKTMSLHSLLSYYDIKLDENAFEVALFAKQFLEMLRRDAVFNIYKSLVVTSEADFVTKEENSAKKPKLMVTTSKRTVNRPLLFSCNILDRDKSNKIPLDDLKCMIDGLGTCQSSDQLSALFNKIKDNSKCFYYRLLTDKEIDDNDITKMLSAEQTDDLDYIKELAMGNKALFDEVESMDTSVDNEEIDRLKNELDKSERCRQTLELRFSEIKEDAERNKVLMQTQNKEIQKLKDQITEYRTKYHHEQDRGDFYKKDFDKLYRDMKDIEKLAVNMGKSVADSIERFKKTDKSVKPEIKPKSETKSKSKEEKSNNANATSNSNNNSNNSSKSNTETMENVSDKPNDDVVNTEDPISHDDITISTDVEMLEPTPETSESKEENLEEKSEENTVDSKAEVSGDANHGHEDFELSKPSDYEIIILDETE